MGTYLPIYKKKKLPIYQIVPLHFTSKFHISNRIIIERTALVHLEMYLHI